MMVPITIDESFQPFQPCKRDHMTTNGIPEDVRISKGDYKQMQQTLQQKRSIEIVRKYQFDRDLNADNPDESINSSRRTHS